MAFDDKLFAVEGHKLIGKIIRKIFDIGPFNGQVVGWRYTKGEDLFRVVYTDNDVEDLTNGEILRWSRGKASAMSPVENDELENAVRQWRIGREESMPGDSQERQIPLFLSLLV